MRMQLSSPLIGPCQQRHDRLSEEVSMTDAAAAFHRLSRVDLDAPGRKSAVKGAPELRRIVASASELVPMLREHAPATEEARRVSSATTEAFHEAGFFKLMQPARYGGYEYGFTAF